MNKETKLGLFVLFGLFLLGLSVMLLGNFQLQGHYNLNILFQDVAGLPSKAGVKIAGVDVGGVKDISLVDGLARVRVWIKDDVKIHEDARARIVSTGVIGSKYLEIVPGSKGAPLLDDGDTVRGVDPVSFDEIVQKVMEQLGKLSEMFSGADGQDFGKNLTASVANLKDITASLRTVITARERQLAATIDNFHAFSSDIAEMTAANKEDIRVAVAEFRSLTGRLDRILAQIETGQGTIGALVSDEQMGENLKDTVAEVKKAATEATRVLKRINLIETQWDYTLRYDGRYNTYRSDIGLRVLPTPEKFYYLGVSNMGDIEDKNGQAATDPEDKTTFDFQIGRIFGPTTVYAGLIRSKGGVGLGYRPFYRYERSPFSRLQVRVQGYDFFRKTPVNRPKYIVGTEMGLTDWAYVGVQYEDPYYLSSFNTYFNLVFRDDDIAYLLGLIGLAKP